MFTEKSIDQLNGIYRKERNAQKIPSNWYAECQMTRRLSILIPNTGEFPRTIGSHTQYTVIID